MTSNLIKTKVSNTIRDNYSSPLCIRCHNDICKVYGGRCRKYRFLRRLSKIIRINSKR